MNLAIQDIWNNKINDITLMKTLESEGEIKIVLPLESVGFSSSYLDVVYDHILVSYCSEKIASFANVIKGEITLRDNYYKDFIIVCTPRDVKNLADCLVYFSKFFSDGSDELSKEDRDSFYDEIGEYELNLNKKCFVFPELVNNYWANLINGAYFEMASEYDSEDEFFKETYKKYPEHRYGFWKNAPSKEYNETIYFSIENWIVPPESNLMQALKIYSGLETDLIIEKADVLNYKGSSVIVNSSSAVWFNEGSLFKSILCTEKTLLRKYRKQLPVTLTEGLDDVQLGIFPEPLSQVNAESYSSRFNFLDSEKFQYHLSEFGDLALVKYLGFNYVFFIRNTLNFEEMKEFNEYLNPVYSKIQNLIGQSCTGNCKWGDLNDDVFEELCYDIIYCHPKFDSTTIQKMGKSRSRDGGRDIVVKTRKTPTSESELFIFQCKFYSNSNSLSASKLSNAGNVIMQYGAKGYGIFTSTIIDSTLYDMLDGFERNMGIDTSIRWSKYELERFLNRNKQLKEKYFKSEN
ncbi:hypothetical protein ACSAZK_06830 [Methanosarcina sp. Mfa9]|uniref:hypothetical protein n=1 Tax=Methanosarcina sp. Mfa9 TaxID=3439063 RepID=UPI003F86DD38